MGGDVASKILDRFAGNGYRGGNYRQSALRSRVLRDAVYLKRFGQLMARGADSSPRVDSLVRLDY
jgi:hypothetical protein